MEDWTGRIPVQFTVRADIQPVRKYDGREKTSERLQRGLWASAAHEVGLDTDVLDQPILSWLSQNQKSANPNSPVDYTTETYMAGMPSIQYHLNASEAADDEFAFLTGLLTPNLGQTQDWAFTAWTGFSYTARHLRQFGPLSASRRSQPKVRQEQVEFLPPRSTAAMRVTFDPRRIDQMFGRLDQSPAFLL